MMSENKASILRDGYKTRYTYFIPMTNDWRVESNGGGEIYDEETGEQIGAEPFSVRLTSQIDSVETLQAFLDNHAALVVIANKATINADGVDTVALNIAGQTNFNYRLMRENIVIEAGVITDGVLEFATDDPAVYLIELKIGSQTGYAKVEAI